MPEPVRAVQPGEPLIRTLELAATMFAMQLDNPDYETWYPTDIEDAHRSLGEVIAQAEQLRQHLAEAQQEQERPRSG